jgi:hypothetical protein
MWREILFLWICSFCSAAVVELDDNSFENALSSDSGFWLLYFYAVSDEFANT